MEIDLPGCSYNPDAEQHQDALAEAVAAEMAKVYAKEHLPLPNKRFNHMPEPDELTALLVSFITLAAQTSKTKYCLRVICNQVGYPSR